MISERPLELIKLSKQGKDVKVELNEEAIKILEKFNEPVKVLSIIGKYRTGKSYFANRFLGVKSGFSVVYGVEGVTKGIWLWYFEEI